MAWILIMEDDTQVRVLAEEILKDAGHNTLSAANVTEALALLRAYALITILFADIRLHEGEPTGLELAQEAVSIRPVHKVFQNGEGVLDLVFNVHQMACRSIKQTLPGDALPAAAPAVVSRIA